jgi:hypothetical protein
MASIAERTRTASRRVSELRESRFRAKYRKTCSTTSRGLFPLTLLGRASPSEARKGTVLRWAPHHDCVGTGTGPLLP